MKRSKLFSIVLCLAALAAQAGAGVYFADDFEDDTVGSLPVIGGTNVGASYGDPLNTLSVEANPDSTVGSGNESAKVLKGAGAGTFANNIIGYFTTAASLNGLTISYDFFSTSGTHDNDGIRTAVVGDAANNRDIFMRNDRDTAILVDGTTQAQTNFGANVWQNWTATFTEMSEAGDYNLSYSLTNLVTNETVTGSQAVTVDLGTFANGQTQGILLEAFEGAAGANNYTGYLDNVRVTPEPATVLMLALGGLYLRRRR